MHQKGFLQQQNSKYYLHMLAKVQNATPPSGNMTVSW